VKDEDAKALYLSSQVLHVSAKELHSYQEELRITLQWCQTVRKKLCATRALQRNENLQMPTHLIEIINHLLPDWQTIIKNQRRSMLQRFLVEGFTDLGSDFKTRVRFDDDLAGIAMTEKERTFTLIVRSQSKRRNERYPVFDTVR